MADLVEATRWELADRELHPLLIVAAFVVHFLAIHPFQMRQRSPVPCVGHVAAPAIGVSLCSVQRIIEESKEGYYRALRFFRKEIRTETESLDSWCGFSCSASKSRRMCC